MAGVDRAGVNTVRSTMCAMGSAEAVILHIILKNQLPDHNTLFMSPMCHIEHAPT